MKKILIVDDEPDILEIYNDLIKWVLPDSVVTSANNGRQGLDLACKETFDLIISDYRMPNLNGVDMAQKILQESMSKNIHTPITILTGYAAEVHEILIERSLHDKVFIVEKPINDQIFQDFVKKLLNV